MSRDSVPKIKALTDLNGEMSKKILRKIWIWLDEMNLFARDSRFAAAFWTLSNRNVQWNWYCNISIVSFLILSNWEMQLMTNDINMHSLYWVHVLNYDKNRFIFVIEGWRRQSIRFVSLFFLDINVL